MSGYADVATEARGLALNVLLNVLDDLAKIAAPQVEGRDSAIRLRPPPAAHRSSRPPRHTDTTPSPPLDQKLARRPKELGVGSYW